MLTITKHRNSSLRNLYFLTLIFSLSIWISACTDNIPDEASSNEVVFFADENPSLLSDWNLLKLNNGKLSLQKNVHAYDLNSSLFTDYAHKLRTVFIPKGAAAQYHASETFDFPVGSIISKTFYYPTSRANSSDNKQVLKTSDSTNQRLVSQEQSTGELGLNIENIKLIETRLLIHRQEGWVALPYVWNADQTDAKLKRTGDILELELHNASNESQAFNYVVPDANQCMGCHATNATTRQLKPIGPKARHLNKPYLYTDGKKNQLLAWDALGLIEGVPVFSDVPQNAVWNNQQVSVTERARAYLDINCSHCHNKVGPADTSGLMLEPNAPYGASLGICKLPIAAGTGTGDREFDIVPGHSDESILVYRMQSTNPAEMMPELGRSLAHDEGVELITEWVNSLSGSCT